MQQDVVVVVVVVVLEPCGGNETSGEELLAAAGLAELKEANEANAEVERERDELRATVDELRAENEALRVVEGEGRMWKGKSMQRAQALENERVAHARTQGYVVKLKEGKQKPKARVEGGEEEAAFSDRTIYRRATALADVIVDVFKNNVGISGRLWDIMMMKKIVKDAFAKAGFKPYHEEADVRETELVDRIHSLVQWAKANHKSTHGRQVYETLCTAVADCREKADGGTFGWVMRRLGIGDAAMTSGMARRKVLDESCFREGVVFKDDRADFKTKNEQFPAEALLQRLFWVTEASRTSLNMGDVVTHCLGAERRRRASHYIIMDFAMNYSHDHLTETQSEFFAKNQTTLLSVVVWFLAPMGSDGKMEVQQHSRVYLSEDRRHSNNCVQKVLDDLLAHFKGIIGKEAAGVEECTTRRLCLWSDGCGGQFKNKWQMNKLLHLVGDVRFGLVGAEHHFFASCHGKGPCDGLGGWTKTYLRQQEMRESIHLDTSMDLFTLLVREKAYGNNAEWAAATGVQLKCRSRTFMFMDLVGVDRGEVKDMMGIKSNHCFVTTLGGLIHMFPTSCTCPPCRAMEYEKCELIASEQRGEGKQMHLRAFTPATQELRSKRGSNLELGRATLAECEVGDWVLMRTDEEQRKVYSEDHPKNWTYRGTFRLAQIAQLPTSAMEGPRPSSRPRRGVGKFLVFYAQEEEVEEKWLFRSALVCYREGGDVPKMWRECSESNDDPCYSEHADDSGLVENVMMRIETRETEDDGQQVCILTDKEKAALELCK